MSKDNRLPEGVLGYECKHVIYTEDARNDTDDALIVKEIVHKTDGTKESRLRTISNYKRPIYITHDAHRNHPDKKESESVTKLQKFEVNQRGMCRKIAQVLRKNLHGLSLKRLARSQYLYGADISPQALVKERYQRAFPDCVSENNVAVLDIETDVVHGTEEILSIGVTMKDKALLVITESFLRGIVDPHEQIHAAFEKYLSEYKQKRNIALDIRIVPTPGRAVVEALKVAHAWRPDIMTAWNMEFDINKMLEALEKEDYNPADVFSDPSVPPHLRRAVWSPGPKVKVTASGRNMPLSNHERWHTFETTSHFYWLDAMGTYAFIRKAKGNLPAYKLDYILKLELGIRKLKFSFADNYTELDWHVFMQTNYRIEYLIYNLFDCISVEELDEKTKDLSITISELSGFSEYRHFNSTPTQLADDLHFFYLRNRNEVISSKSDQMEDELDQHVISMQGHIVTLATHLNAPTGLKLFEDFPNLMSLIRAFVADLDVKSALIGSAF